MVIRGVVFDLDDTLYRERDYVRSGFRHIAALVGRSERERSEVARWLAEAFENGRRGDTFDALLKVFTGLAQLYSVEDLVREYRAHRPAIQLGPDVEPTLDAIRATGVRLGILSDGPLASQSAKADALQLQRWFEPIVFTAALGPEHGKPARTGFEAIAHAWGIRAGALAYVADNPVKDFIGPKELGWLTIRLRQPEQLYWQLEAARPFHEPDAEIRSPAELLGILVRGSR